MISNLLESSDSAQRNEGCQGIQEDNRRKSVAGTVAHQSDLIDFHLLWSGSVMYTFRFRHRRDGSCPVATASRSILSHVFSCFSIHHAVLDHQSIMIFWIVSLEHLLVPTTLRRARCWVRSCCCFPKKRASVFSLTFSLTLCDVMLATSPSLSLTPLTSLAGRL